MPAPRLIKNPPHAPALMEASRSFGNYDLASALADLIDNSISANASKISIDCECSESSQWIRVVDDGCGMSSEELVNAMRPASRSPLEKRDKDDLGRFGLGLKTASFSQARQLTVITNQNNKVSAAEWDLDEIEDWSMKVFSGKEATNLFLENNLFETSTEVIWRKLDRITEASKISRSDFNRLFISAADRLSLIFHRYLESRQTPNQRQIELYLNGDRLKPHDPFKREHPATQELETEKIQVSNGKVVITPFILPHFSKLVPGEYEKLAGEEGYIKNQGFYVYRNRRLIIYGTWFRLFRHGELSKLARVRVDIPNTIDAEWRITVDKSDAQIPTVLRRRLIGLIERIGGSSSRVYRQRGSRLKNSKLIQLWIREAKKGQIKFVINQEHPSVINFLENLNQDQKNRFIDLLNMFASSFPIEALHAEYADNPNKLSQSETVPEQLVDFAERFVSDRLNGGMLKEELLALLMSTEPFSNNYDFLVEVLKEREVFTDD